MVVNKAFIIGRDKKFLLLLLILSLFLRLVNIHYPDDYYFDENYTAYTGIQIAQNNRLEIWEPANEKVAPPMAYEWVHPPLARELIAVFVILFENYSWVRRLPSLISGVLSIGLIYGIGMQLFSKDVGKIAAVLLALETLFLSSSIIATPDSLMVCLILLSVYLSLNNRRLLGVVTLSLAIATKWVAGCFLPVLIVLDIWSKEKIQIRTLLTRWVGRLAIIILIYLLAYLPFFSAGGSINDFVALQIAMLKHGMNVRQFHTFTSAWWQWIWGFKPILYHADQERQMWAMPNFLILWLGIVSVILTIIYLIKSYRDKNSNQNTKYLGISLLAYLSAVIPWFFIWVIESVRGIPHRSTFLYYYLPAIPFMVLMTAYWLSKFSKSEYGNYPLNIFKIFWFIIGSIFLLIYPRIIGL